MSKLFIRFIQCNASGNHCVIDILESAGFYRLSDYMEYFISAYIIYKKNPSLKYHAPKSNKLDFALGHLRTYANFWKIQFIEKDVNDDFLLKVFEVLSSKKKLLFFAHGTGLFTHSKMFNTSIGKQIIWSSEYAKEASSKLEFLISKNQYIYQEVALLRHPLDILLSRIERYKVDKKNFSEYNNFIEENSSNIRETFELVRFKSEEYEIPIIKYEDIINYKGTCLKPLINISKEKSETIENKIFFSKSSINKRYSVSISKNKFFLEKLKLNFSWTGYENMGEKSAFSFYCGAIQQKFFSNLSDIKLAWIINFCEYKKEGQINHHKLKLIARIFFKVFNVLSILLLQFRKN